jgi:Fe2+ or Zn2+ uptake regulation protein
MAIERDGYNGPISYCCDNCGDIEETRCAEFSGAHAKVKAHGWRTFKAADEWQHHCPDCARKAA